MSSVAFFVVMNNLTKYSTIPSEQKVFIRSLVGMAIVFAMARVGMTKIEFNNLRLLALRGGLGALSVLAYFYSIDNTTLGRASFFQFTYPAWGALFSFLFLKEALGWRRVPAMLLTFAGAYLILFSNGGLSLADVNRGDISGVLCGLFSGAAVTTVRACHKYDSTHMIFLFFTASAVVLGGAVTWARGSYVPPDASGWAVLVAIGVTGTVAQLLFTAGYRYLDVAAGGSIAMLQAPLSAIAAWVIFKEGMAGQSILGGAFVLAGGAFLAMTSRGVQLDHTQNTREAAAHH